MLTGRGKPSLLRGIWSQRGFGSFPVGTEDEVLLEHERGKTTRGKNTGF